MSAEDQDPSGWEALKSLTGCIKNGTRYWGEVAGEVEVHVSSHGTLAFSKHYRSRGRNLELPWIELTEDELRGILTRGDELLAAIDAARERTPEDA